MRTDSARFVVTNRNGFVMPVVILAIVVLGTLTVAALTTATDEVRSSAPTYCWPRWWILPAPYSTRSPTT